jgi:hypothetical protein
MGRPTIGTISFDRRERPVHASIRTKFGLVRVYWRSFGSKRLWFASGSLDAQYEAAIVIEHISMLFDS